MSRGRAWVALFICWTWWFGVNPLNAAYFWNDQNVYRIADFNGIGSYSYFYESFCIGAPIFIKRIPVPIVESNHCRITTKKIKFCASRNANFVNRIYRKSSSFSNELKVSFVNFQSIIFNTCKKYLQGDVVPFLKFIFESKGVSLPDRDERSWQYIFDYCQRFSNIAYEVSIFGKSCIDCTEEVKTNSWLKSNSGSPVKKIENLPNFTNRRISSGVAIFQPLAICGNDYSIFEFNNYDSSLGDSILIKKKDEQENFNKPRYIRLTHRGISVEAVLGQGYPIYGLYSFDVDVSTDECKTWFHLFDDKCLNGLPNYFNMPDSLKTK